MSARPSKQTLRQLAFAIALDAGEGAPKWQKIFPLGETRYRGDFGSITFDRTFLEQMLRNYAAEGKPARPWDYFHRGSSDDTEVANENKVAAGWFSDMELRADGLYVLTEWTARAEASIKAKELRYPSPTFAENATDPKTGKPCGPKLFAVALLNDPFLTDLPPVEASSNPLHPKGHTMDPIKLAALVAAAGLPEGATEEQLLAHLATTKDAPKKLGELDEKVKLAASKDVGVGELLKKFSEKLDAQTEELKKLRSERSADAVTALTTKLEGEGRILATEKTLVATCVERMGLDEATKFTASWPVKVDLKERGANIKNGSSDMTPAEANKQLTAKAEELVKAGTPRIEATKLAMEQNPSLAEAAFKLVKGAEQEARKAS